MAGDLAVMYASLVVLCVVFAIASVMKIVVVVRYRGTGVTVILKSFFRIYNSMELKMTSSNKKRFYMKYNNLINGLLYTSIALLLIIAVMYRIYL